MLILICDQKPRVDNNTLGVELTCTVSNKRPENCPKKENTRVFGVDCFEVHWKNLSSQQQITLQEERQQDLYETLCPRCIHEKDRKQIFDGTFEAAVYGACRGCWIEQETLNHFSEENEKPKQEAKQ